MAVGGVVIDKVPESGKELAIRLFGTYDKMALQIGTVVVLCAIAAVLGAAQPAPAAGSAWPASALFGVIGVAAAVTRAGADRGLGAAVAARAAAAAATLWCGVRRARRVPRPDPEWSPPEAPAHADGDRPSGGGSCSAIGRR